MGATFEAMGSLKRPHTSRLQPSLLMVLTWLLAMLLVLSISSQPKMSPPSLTSTALKDNQSNGRTYQNVFLTFLGQIPRKFLRIWGASLIIQIDCSPLNTIGMPHYNTLLLSSWTPHFVSHGSHYPPPPSIPPQISSAIKVNDNIAYAALPKELRGKRNRAVVPSTKDQGRFRSGKNRKDDVSIQWAQHGFRRADRK